MSQVPRGAAAWLVVVAAACLAALLFVSAPPAWRVAGYAVVVGLAVSGSVVMARQSR